MKLLLPLVVVFALAAAAVVSVRHAVADQMISSVNSQLYEAGKVRAATGLEIADSTWNALEADAKQAIRLAPSNGHYWNTLARIYYQPRSIGASPASPDYAAAYRASTSAVVVQPGSGYLWSSLSFASDQLFVQNQLPGGNAALEQSISRAAVLGAREPAVLSVVVDLGLANWPTLGIATKQDVLAAVRHLALRHKDDVTAIAARRGALPTVCGEFAAVGEEVCKNIRSDIAARNTSI
jgi:hypothetical protein